MKNSADKYIFSETFSPSIEHEFALSQYEMNEIRALNKEDRFFKSTMETTARMCSQFIIITL